MLGSHRQLTKKWKEQPSSVDQVHPATRVKSTTVCARCRCVLGTAMHYDKISRLSNLRDTHTHTIYYTIPACVGLISTHAFDYTYNLSHRLFLSTFSDFKCTFNREKSARTWPTA